MEQPSYKVQTGLPIQPSWSPVRNIPAERQLSVLVCCLGLSQSYLKAHGTCGEVNSELTTQGLAGQPALSSVELFSVL